MEKAIYGLANAFDMNVFDYDSLTNSFVFKKITQEAIELAPVIYATISHDYSQLLGDTSSNLIIKVNNHGIYFKLIPNCKRSLSAYKKVKRGALRHCSISFYPDRIHKQEVTKLVTKHPTERVYVHEYKQVYLTELCLGNKPRNASTFCTTDKNHPLLKGVIWDE